MAPMLFIPLKTNMAMGKLLFVVGKSLFVVGKLPFIVGKSQFSIGDTLDLLATQDAIVTTRMTLYFLLAES